MLTREHPPDDPVDAPLLDEQARQEQRAESAAGHGQHRVQHDDGQQPANRVEMMTGRFESQCSNPQKY